MSLVGCSSFIINGGVFTNVNGSSPEERKELTMFDDYNRVKPGDMHIEENISTTSVRRKYNGWDVELMKQYELWQDVDARRNIGIARLRGEDKEDKFLCVTYDGPDAFKAFKQDFDQFAYIKNANVAQVFGYNDNERGLPALVFYDALIPLARIALKGDQPLPLLYSYFAHQLGRMQRELAVGVLPLGELWVDPRTSALQQGPYVELSFFQSWTVHGTGENTMPNDHSARLHIQTYSDNDAVFEYLTKTFTARTILTGICWASRMSKETVANEQVISVLSSCPGVIYNQRSQDIVTGLPGARERWRYGFWRVLGRIPDGMRESQIVKPDGSVRFTVTSAEIRDLHDIDLQCLLCPLGEWITLAESWLAQAHSIFGQLGIHEDEWEDYGVHIGSIVRLERTSPHKEPIIPANAYLFIRPIPRPSDDPATWRSWLEGEKYFWSFDPLGQEMVPEPVRAHLGLPSFASKIASQYTSWSPGHYNAIQKLHTSEGFDPATTDFALSLGFFVLEVIGDQHRFEDLGESSSNSLRRFAGTLKRQGARFITRAEVGLGAKKSDMAVTSLGETTSTKGFTRRLKDVFHIRRSTGLKR